MMLAGLSVINREKLLQLFQKHTKESTTLRPTEEGLFGRKVQPSLGSNFCFVKGVHEISTCKICPPTLFSSGSLLFWSVTLFVMMPSTHDAGSGVWEHLFLEGLCDFNVPWLLL